MHVLKEEQVCLRGHERFKAKAAEVSHLRFFIRLQRIITEICLIDYVVPCPRAKEDLLPDRSRDYPLGEAQAVTGKYQH